MAGFRDRRIRLLGLVVLICGALIMMGGPHWGIDITGGSEIMLRIQTSQVQLGFDTTPTTDEINTLIDDLEDNLNASILRLTLYEDIETTNKMLLEIGKPVTENMISPLLGDDVHIIEGPEEKVSEFTRDDVKHILDMRVNLLGTKKTQFKSIGTNFILFEVAEPLDRARELLGHLGQLEVFIENEQVLRGEHLASVDVVGSDRETQPVSYFVPFNLTEEGAQRFADGALGKTGYPGVIYLDRPDDAILLFTAQFRSSVVSDANREEQLYEDVSAAEYDENARMFRFLTSRQEEQHWFYLQVPAVEIEVDNIPTQTLQYLENQRGLKNRVIFLGELDDLSENIVNGENLISSSENLFPIEAININFGELTTDWLLRAGGVRSWPSISEDLATGELEKVKKLRITTGTSAERAQDMRVILSQRLSVKITTESEREMDARLGGQFLEEAANAAVIAFLAVGALVYIRYRRFKIVIPLMVTMACEVTIILGIASALPVITFGLPEIGGLIAVVGTGVDHQIIISDEVLAGVSSPGRIPVERRVGRAFSIIFAAAATTIAAMIMLATLGFGTMRGFALVTMLGVLVSVLITRPAYARIIGILLARESRE